MKLYPFKFEPHLCARIWGGHELSLFKNLTPVQDGMGESWEISDCDHALSVISNGPWAKKTLREVLTSAQDQLVGKHVYQRFGNQFPLLIKFIDAQSDLSIQVHPDDALAKKRHNSFGKTEMWYVMKAQPYAALFSGFSKLITPQQYVAMVQDGTFMDALQKYEVKPGDVFFLPAGRVHAIGGGLLVAEIQQTSDITYRIFDYNRKDKDGKTRELHTELAKDAIHYEVLPTYQTAYKPASNSPVTLASCPYFHTNLLDLDASYERNVQKLDSFVIYMCLEGMLSLEADGETYSLKQGETILVPASCMRVTLIPRGKTKLLEVYIPF